MSGPAWPILVNEAALRAARLGEDAVDATDFDEAIDRVVAGIERKSRVINPKEKEIVAYHEAGHALVAESRAHTDRVAKVSVIPRGVAALGVVDRAALMELIAEMESPPQAIGFQEQKRGH